MAFIILRTGCVAFISLEASVVLFQFFDESSHLCISVLDAPIQTFILQCDRCIAVVEHFPQGFLHNPHIDFAKIMAAQTPAQMQDYLMTLKPVQIKLLNLWFIYLGGISFVYTLLTMFWFPAMLFESKNPFLALWANFKFVFRNFFGSLGIVSYLFLMNFVVSGINALSGINIVLSIISLVITFYFMTYCLVLLFLYYGEKR